MYLPNSASTSSCVVMYWSINGSSTLSTNAPCMAGVPAAPLFTVKAVTSDAYAAVLDGVIP